MENIWFMNMLGSIRKGLRKLKLGIASKPFMSICIIIRIIIKEVRLKSMINVTRDFTGHLSILIVIEYVFVLDVIIIEMYW